ncbi:hypothetical protein ABZZ20_36780, partial [Streptomyces sp. NPDC006430]|uniref:hypothetical protein n=1 Tax=Streptomyces sp. NPDC006430 TaxID=3154299 RepID=UPI0033B4766F
MNSTPRFSELVLVVPSGDVVVTVPVLGSTVSVTPPGNKVDSDPSELRRAVPPPGVEKLPATGFSCVVVTEPSGRVVVRAPSEPTVCVVPSGNTVVSDPSRPRVVVLPSGLVNSTPRFSELVLVVPSGDVVVTVPVLGSTVSVTPPGNKVDSDPSELRRAVPPPGVEKLPATGFSCVVVTEPSGRLVVTAPSDPMLWTVPSGNVVSTEPSGFSVDLLPSGLVTTPPGAKVVFVV